MLTPGAKMSAEYVFENVVMNSLYALDSSSKRTSVAPTPTTKE